MGTHPLIRLAAVGARHLLPARGEKDMAVGWVERSETANAAHKIGVSPSLNPSYALTRLRLGGVGHARFAPSFRHRRA